MGYTPKIDRVAEMLAEGMTLPEIAMRMRLSLTSIDNYLSKICRQLGPQAR